MHAMDRPILTSQLRKFRYCKITFEGECIQWMVRQGSLTCFRPAASLCSAASSSAYEALEDASCSLCRCRASCSCRGTHSNLLDNEQ